MAVRIKTGRAAAALSITPLIDVVFMLLVFFVVTSRFADEDENFDQQEKKLEVSLPSASEAVPLTARPKELFINIDADGNYVVATDDGDRQTLGPDEVERILQRSVVNNPVSQQVIIRADKSVSFEHVVFVMNACNKHGIFDYSLSMEGGD